MNRDDVQQVLQEHLLTDAYLQLSDTTASQRLHNKKQHITWHDRSHILGNIRKKAP